MKRLTVLVLAALLATATDSAAAGGPGEATAPPGTRAFGIARLKYGAAATGTRTAPRS